MDLIDRQAAIAEFSCCEITQDGGIDANYAIDFLKNMPSAQTDLITKMQNGIKATDADDVYSCGMRNGMRWCISLIDGKEPLYESCPSAQPTLYGYNIEHLELIARVLQKENLPPERIVEVLTDIGRIVAIVRYEFEETLRKAVDQCKI